MPVMIKKFFFFFAVSHHREMLCLCFTAIYNQTITEGSEIIVRCENEGRVTWSKRVDGKRTIILTAQDGHDPAPNTSDPGNRYSVLANLSLIIKEVSVSDSGVYYCNATAVMNLRVAPLKGGWIK